MHLCASCSSGAWRGRMGAATQRKPGACNVGRHVHASGHAPFMCCASEHAYAYVLCVCVCGWVGRCSAVRTRACARHKMLFRCMHSCACCSSCRRYGHRGRSLARCECAYVIQCVQMLAPMHVSESTLCARAWACACAPTLRIQAPLCAVLNNFCFV